jgi:hypothetical protein
MSRNRYRIIYSALLIAAFFIPAYSNVSAYRFIGLAIGSAQTDAEVTFMDALVILIPLLFIPLSALLILFRALRQKPINGLLLSLPLFFLLFFFLILSFDVNRETSNADMFGMLKDMRFGFYMAALTSVLLLFSYSKRESLNFDPKT